MKLLVVAAAEFEIAPFMQESNNSDILITGIGIPETTFNLAKKLCQERYDLVIQAGIAGMFHKKFKKSSVVVVSQDAFGDIGIEENKSYSTLFDSGLVEADARPYCNGWLLNATPLLSQIKLPATKAVTVNTVTDDKEKIEKLVKKFDPDVESMEGAAFHYVCLCERVNFLQIRSISNEVGERDKTKWEMKTAIANLNNELKKLVQNFS